MMNILKDTSFKVSTVVMHGYASPDGETKHNADLTYQRTASALDVVKSQMKKAGIKKVYDSTFVRQPDNGEDWVGLQRVVSQMNFDGKNDVLAVLNDNSLSNDQKEDKLRTLPAWNSTLVNNVLPKLRRTEVIFSGSMPDRSLDELNAMAKDQSRLAEMTKRELITLGNKTEDTATKLAIYKSMMDRWPDDWAGKNNYAAILLKQGKYEEANTMFEDLHKAFPENDTITSNLGVAKRFARKYNDAKDLYTAAQEGGVKENNNMGILYIKYGDYTSAVNSFEPSRCDYNTALAYTLKGDYDQALQKIDCITDKTADVYYLRAIVGARKGDKDMMTTSLTRAVQMDPSIRERAKDDMEFRKYNKTSEFTNSIR
jgi:tetratricopeptide (TPR) repeat protein